MKKEKVFKVERLGSLYQQNYRIAYGRNDFHYFCPEVFEHLTGHHLEPGEVARFKLVRIK